MLLVLRFVGVMNAAVWLGATFFFTFGAGPAFFSPEMRNLLKENYPYFSGGVAQIVVARYFYWQLACALIAVAHLLGEWIYLGKTPPKLTASLLGGILCLGLLGGFWLQPKLKSLHRIKYSPAATAGQRLQAAASFRGWHGASQGMNLIVLIGLAVYCWRTTNPPDSLRFVGAAKFKG